MRPPHIVRKRNNKRRKKLREKEAKEEQKLLYTVLKQDVAISNAERRLHRLDAKYAEGERPPTILAKRDKLIAQIQKFWSGQIE